MKRLSFVIWTMGWPFICAIAGALSELSGHQASDDAQFFAAVVDLMIWVCVAVMLWRDENPKVEEEQEEEAKS